MSDREPPDSVREALDEAERKAVIDYKMELALLVARLRAVNTQRTKALLQKFLGNKRCR